MVFEPDGVTITVRAGETILAALQRQGYTHAVGCRRGGCGRCKVVVLSGRVGYRVTIAPEVLSPSERVGGWCLSCRAEPATDVVVHLEAEDHLTCLIPWVRPTIRPSWAKPTLPGEEPPR